MSGSLKKIKKKLDKRVEDYNKNFASQRGYTKPGSMKK